MFGRARSLQISGWLGMVAWALIVFPAFLWNQWLLGCVAVFLGFQSWNAVRTGNFLQQMGKLPRRDDLHCPSCGEAPVVGEHWLCAECEQPFDIFERHGLCPHCGRQLHTAPCPFCGRSGPLAIPATGVVDVEVAAR
jgi:hypothetical protein